MECPVLAPSSRCLPEPGHPASSAGQVNNKKGRKPFQLWLGGQGRVCFGFRLFRKSATRPFSGTWPEVTLSALPFLPSIPSIISRLNPSFVSHLVDTIGKEVILKNSNSQIQPQLQGLGGRASQLKAVTVRLTPCGLRSLCLDASPRSSPGASSFAVFRRLLKCPDLYAMFSDT